jgi:chromosome partitioning protein
VKTIAVANMKGGTGKSTLAVHLASGLARNSANKVLLVDLDPQANTTEWLEQLGAQKGTANVMMEGAIHDDHFIPLANRGTLDLLPSTPKLSGIDGVLAQEMGAHAILGEALEKRKGEWDFVIIDCPPNLGTSVANALCASDAVLAPLLGAYFSLAGLRRLEEAVQRAQKHYRARAELLGYVLFAVDDRENLMEETRALLRKDAPGRLFKSEVRVSTAAKSLAARRELAWDGKDPRGAEDYERLLAEFSRRLRPRAKAVA